MVTEDRLTITNGYLRQLMPSDIHLDYIEGLNNPKVNSFLELRHVTQTFETVESFVAENLVSTDSLLWGVWASSQTNHIGTIRIHNISKGTKSCFIGICIFDSRFWGQGIATMAIKAVTNWAHTILKVSRVEAHAYLENIASIRAFENAGFLRTQDSYKAVISRPNSVRHAVLIADSATKPKT